MEEENKIQSSDEFESESISAASINTFEEVIAEAHSQINSKDRVDTQDILSSLLEMQEVPEDVSPGHIDMLIELLFSNCPKNLNNERDRENHVRTITILDTFLKDKRVIDRFKPTQTEMQKLKLARLINSSNEKYRALGLEISYNILENSEKLLPIDLLSKEHQAIAIYDRYHEKKQQVKLIANTKAIDVVQQELKSFQGILTELDGKVKQFFEQKSNTESQETQSDITLPHSVVLDLTVDKYIERVEEVDKCVKENEAGVAGFDQKIAGFKLEYTTLLNRVKKLETEKPKVDPSVPPETVAQLLKIGEQMQQFQDSIVLKEDLQARLDKIEKDLVHKVSNELNSRAVFERLNGSDKLIESLNDQVKLASAALESGATKADLDAMKLKVTSVEARMDEMEGSKQLDDSKLEDIRVLAKTLPSQIRQIQIESELRGQEISQNSQKQLQDFLREQEEQVQKIRDYFGLQFKTIKQDQEKTYLENNEHKSFSREKIGFEEQIMFKSLVVQRYEVKLISKK